MTVNVQNVLNKINNNEIFNDKLYFVGGTALAYYLNHRISEDIDIVSANTLKYKQEPKEDEAVYLNEKDKIDLCFEEIKKQVVEKLRINVLIQVKQNNQIPLNNSAMILV